MGKLSLRILYLREWEFRMEMEALLCQSGGGYGNYCLFKC